MEKIKELFKKINELYAGHKFLLIITYLSIIFGILFEIRLCIWMLLFKGNYFYQFVLLSPFSFFPTLLLILHFIFCKYLPEVAKFMLIFINTILFLIFNSVFYVSLLPLISDIVVLNLPRNPKNYQYVMERDFSPIGGLVFFPKEIPANAKNVEWRIGYNGYSHTNEKITQLKFRTTPQYIRNIKKEYYIENNISDRIISDIKVQQRLKRGLKSNDAIYQIFDDNTQYGYTIGYICIDEINNEVLYKWLIHYDADNNLKK